LPLIFNASGAMITPSAVSRSNYQHRYRGHRIDYDLGLKGLTAIQPQQLCERRKMKRMMVVATALLVGISIAE